MVRTGLLFRASNAPPAHCRDARRSAARRSAARRSAAHRRVRDAGVTLIEMMVVLVIIGIVAALVVPNVIGRPDEARVAVATADLRTIAASLEMYRLDNRSYPTTEQGLSALIARPDLAPVPANWMAGGYLPNLPVDPWGNPYLYVAPGEAGPFQITSLAADEAPGGNGVAADIVYGGGIVAADAGEPNG